jgi:hypothetical protein
MGGSVPVHDANSIMVRKPGDRRGISLTSSDCQTTRNKNKIIYPQITQIYADFKNKKIFENQIGTILKSSQDPREDYLSTDKQGFTQIIEKEKCLESLIPVSSLLICG